MDSELVRPSTVNIRCSRTDQYFIGMILLLVPMYQTEVSPPHSRGMMVGLHGVTITLGFTTGSWIGYGFYFVNASGAQWRVPLAIQALPPLVLACGILFMPESPRWCKPSAQY